MTLRDLCVASVTGAAAAASAAVVLLGAVAGVLVAVEHALARDFNYTLAGIGRGWQFKYGDGREPAVYEPSAGADS